MPACAMRSLSRRPLRASTCGSWACSGPDKWVPFLAARFYWTDMLAAGVKVYQYTPGMMHTKYVLVDGEWASVGSANSDNRSLLLNFEANCQFFDAALVAELEEAYLEIWSVGAAGPGGVCAAARWSAGWRRTRRGSFRRSCKSGLAARDTRDSVPSRLAW